jgi:hypothetical protein
MAADNIFPDNWGLKDTDELFPKMDVIPDSVLSYDSPFGEESLFSSSQNTLVDGSWKYKIETSINGNELLTKYMANDSAIENSKGKSKDDIDFIIYVETKSVIELNRVVLIRMSKAMREYIITQYKNNPVDFYNKISIDLLKNPKIKISKEELINAFTLEMQYRSNKIISDNGQSYTVSEFISKLFDSISDSLRGLKISEKYWNPDPGKAAQKPVFRIAPVITLIKSSLPFLKTVVPKKFYQVIITTIKVIEATEKLYNTTETSDKIAFAFLCGAINGLIEFLAGIIDIILIIIEFILVSETYTDAEEKLFVDGLTEIIENFTEAYIRNPLFITEAVVISLSQYISQRYSNNSSNYVRAHNAGEDAVLIIDLIVSVITVVKAFPKAGQKLPKFTKWIDDAIKRNGKLAKALDEFPERKMLNDVDNGSIKLDEFPDGKKRKPGDNTRYANYGEIKSRLFFEDNTFRIGKNEGTLKYISLDKVTDLDAPIRKGIDAVYEFSNHPPKYIITEVKMNTTGSKSWKPPLSKTVTKSGGSQMTDKWIEFNLRMEFDKRMAMDIIDSGYERILVGVSKENDMILETLDKTGKTTNNIINVVK